MNKNFSVYLDALRFLSALTVMAAHMTFPEFTGGMVAYQGTWAGVGVTVFFVLSGYVIRFVSVEKEHTIHEFALSRMARIYSVAIPALLLTMVLDGVGALLGSARPLPMYQYTQLWKYMPVFLSFLTDVGPIREATLSNGVFWSLSYEVWYYVLFAVVIYLTGWKRAILAIALLAALGPRILIYLPMWLSGVFLYEIHQWVSMSRFWARLLFVVSLCAFFAIRLTGVDDIADAWMNRMLGGYPEKYLRNSQYFAGRYMFASVVFLNLFAAKYAGFEYLSRPRVRSAIVYCASFTFTLYLAHLPLLNFYNFIMRHDPHSPASISALAAMVLVSTWLFGLVTEHKKGWWRALFSRFIKVPAAGERSGLDNGKECLNQV